MGALNKAEVFDAEITGALVAAQLTTRFLKKQSIPAAAHYFLDNQAVVSGLLKVPPGPFVGQAPEVETPSEGSTPQRLLYLHIMSPRTQERRGERIS